jgi:hypothetical protein
LITEFEGLIDEFTIVDGGKAVLTLESDDARERYRRIRARFSQTAPDLDLKDALHVMRKARELEVIADGAAAAIHQRLQQYSPEELTSESLTLEEIFVATLKD